MPIFSDLFFWQILLIFLITNLQIFFLISFIVIIVIVVIYVNFLLFSDKKLLISGNFLLVFCYFFYANFKWKKSDIQFAFQDAALQAQSMAMSQRKREPELKHFVELIASHGPCGYSFSLQGGRGLQYIT